MSRLFLAASLTCLLLADVQFVELHGPAGQVLFVNPAEVTSLRAPLANGHLAAGTKCLLVMANRNFIGVREPCDETRRILEQRRTRE